MSTVDRGSPARHRRPPAEGWGGGRPRDASRDDALRRAALELVAEVGYDRVTIEAVAARAGAGKATVYRRWSGKAELVVDAVAHDQVPAQPPDTGSLRGDLTALADWLFSGDSHRFKVRLITGMVPGLLADPELRDAFARVGMPPQRALEAIIARAVARGEVRSPADAAILAAALPALALQRLVFTGQGPDRALVDAVIETILLPALTCPNEPGTSSASGRS